MDSSARGGGPLAKVLASPAGHVPTPPAPNVRQQPGGAAKRVACLPWEPQVSIKVSSSEATGRPHTKAAEAF